MQIPRDLVDRWTNRRDELQKLHAAVDGAAICEEVLADLDALQRLAGETMLKLSDAAAVSGYSRDHLARLLREGKLPNTGRKGAPRIRITDLPRRPSTPLAGSRPTQYDPDADARALRGVR
jgi:hypothetical protein